MKSKKDRPGVMIYFDGVGPALELLSDVKAGRMLKAILRYGQTGEDPGFGDDKVMAVAWSLVKPSLDRDRDAYEERVRRGAYGAYKRELMKCGEMPMNYSLWVESGCPTKKTVSSLRELTGTYVLPKLN